MKIFLSSRRLFAIGFFILITTNVIVLAGVAANRSGKPEALIELTERELQLPYYNTKEENSGLSLRLDWRTLDEESDTSSYYGYYSRSRYPEWFTADKLMELGFDLDAFKKMSNKMEKYKEPIPKQVFIVLELDGEPYQRAVKRAEAALTKIKERSASHPDDRELKEKLKNAEKRLVDENTSSPRLFAVDAGLYPEKLRAKYPDRGKYIITRGLVEASRTHFNKKEKINGYISELSVDNIHVPLEHRKIIDAVLEHSKPAKNEERSPRYTAQVAYGSRFEPWIVSISSLENKSK